MNLSEIRDEIRFITRTNSSTFSDTNIDTGVNLHIAEIIQLILKVNTDKNTAGSIVKTNLVSVTGLSEGDVGFNGEYPFPTDLIRPVRIQIKYPNADRYKKATFYDITENGESETDKTEINSTFSTTNPYVRFYRDSYFIRPLPESNVSNGIYIWYEQRQTDLSNDTDTPDFETNFHNILVYMGAVRYSLRHQDIKNYHWKQEITKIKKDLSEFYKSRFKKSSKLSAADISFE